MPGGFMAAQTSAAPSFSGEKLSRRIHFDLGVLFKHSELQELADKHRVGFLDSLLAPLAGSPESRNWCAVITNGGRSTANCATCPVVQLASKPVGNSTWQSCVGGIERPLVPLLFNGMAVGWVTARPFLAGGEEPLLKMISETALREEFESLNVPSIRREDIEEAMSHAVAELGPVCIERRRKEILQDGYDRILEAKDGETAWATLFGAIEQIYGPLKAVYLYEEPTDLRGKYYRLVRSAGPDAKAEYYEIPQEKTHIGLAIKNREVHYEPRLKDNDPHFTHRAKVPRPKSVLTIPLFLGSQSTPAAVQLQSNEEDFFREPADRDAVRLLARLAGEVSSKLALRKDLDAANLRADSARSWNDFIAGILLDNSWSRFEILKKKQEVYNRLVEQLGTLAGSGCVGTSVRLINRQTDIFGFVACKGIGFTPERSKMLYSRRHKGAAHKAIEVERLYYKDVSKEKDYFELIPETKSLWIRRFVVHGEIVGIVAVDWGVVNGCSDEMDRQFSSLISQFERVLEVLADREEVLLRDLQAPVSDRVDLGNVTKSLVDRLKDLFEARTCELFLDRDGQNVLSLAAATDRGSSVSEIAFDTGITGVVTRYRKSVRIGDANSQAQLDEVRNLHNIRNELRRDDNQREGIDYHTDLGRLSFLAAPLIARDRVLGVVRLMVKNNPEHEFTHQDETFLQEIANRLAQSLDARWVAEDSDRRMREMEQAAEWRKRLDRALGLTEVCQVLTDQFMHRLQTRGAYLHVSDESESLEAGVASGILKELLTFQAPPELPLSEALSSRIWDDPQWRPLCRSLKDQLSDFAPELIQAAVSIPLKIGNAEAVLVLAWQGRREINEPFKRELADLKTDAIESLDAALKQARTQRDQQQTLEELERLRDLAIACASRRSPEEICDEILRDALGELSLNYGTVRLHQEVGWVRQACRGRTDDEVIPQVIGTNRSLKKCLSSQGPFVVRAADPEWLCDLEGLAPGPRRAYLETIKYFVAVPFHMEEKCLGVILLESFSQTDVSERKLEFLRTLGHYASVAIHSIKANQKEMESRPFEMMGAMLSGFLHVMRNKVNNAMANLGLLELEKLPQDERTRTIAEFESDLKTIQEVCKDLVHFSGPADTTKAPVYVNNLFRRIWDEMPDRQKGNVTLDIRTDPSSPFILGNEAQIQVAIRMLVQNALEAMPNGGTLRYWTRAKGEEVIVRVGDTGCGMDKETKRKCESLFYTTKPKGTGMGLAVVVTLARHHRGRLSFVSRCGRGTIFKIRFSKEEERHG